MQVVHGMASAFKGLSLKDTQDSHSDRITEDCRTLCVVVMLGCFVDHRNLQLSELLKASVVSNNWRGIEGGAWSWVLERGDLVRPKGETKWVKGMEVIGVLWGVHQVWVTLKRPSTGLS